MKIKTRIWDGVYILFLSIIVANYWVGFFLERVSFLPLVPFLTYSMAAICGALAYFFFKSVRKAFYASMTISVLSCIIVGIVLFMPSYLDIIDTEVGIYLALWVGVQMFLYIFPLSIGGSMVAAFFFPD